MASTTSKKSRKGLAIGLAILGVAGLSLASASALNLTGTPQLQAGVKDVAGCQSSSIAVAFATPTLTAGTYSSSTLSLTAFDAACTTAAAKYKVALLGAGNVLLGTEFSGNVATGALTLTLGAGQTADSITRVAVTIYN